jgi:hypothetical protein
MVNVGTSATVLYVEGKRHVASGKCRKIIMWSATEDLLTRHRLTVSHYYRMSEAGSLHEDSRVELIEGEIIGMALIGSPRGGTVRQLSELFYFRLTSRL